MSQPIIGQTSLKPGKLLMSFSKTIFYRIFPVLFFLKYQWRSPLVQKLPLLKGSQSRNAESDRERYESIKCELKHRSISIIADLNQILWSTFKSNSSLLVNHFLLHCWRKISQSQTFAPRGRRRLSNLTTGKYFFFL